ncbi:16S rRNA m7G527 methyltransferase [Campylobacter blaseri]|uniref:Ribosomal RNA small subunit methyltransferase G n=1 Tax=Campylobacter blaseri TaxID=2042961 RepID=A0A2P8R0N2_9BACT|nr:16S rRNA (guanine(527)-N(7))-methyltransferase RsmG [Campylobacter blaseri]PSM52040.1 16S rRNA (guanine(527)-N(7))-methyltransferase RsmG [Campylobacter blaseri]PSM53825.1 16S rRNA (guanine(527)-N(7))-methyltransferase RsmG [Campylobacter blaseri]QKF85623.1 16S rRNA m7G527 methyltransferase [Campylobacter blaseri]
MKFDIPDDFNEKVLEFDEILKKFNAIHNLTNYDNLNPIVKDSINGLKYITNTPTIAIDIGSGAGFPAIFLAMILKDCKWHLFEPIYKKSSFLTYAKLNLNLKNVTIHSSKIEDEKSFRADLITSRALMHTKRLLEICQGYYDENTEFLLYKGSSYQSEIEGLSAKVFNHKTRNYILFKGVN